MFEVGPSGRKLTQPEINFCFNFHVSAFLKDKMLTANDRHREEYPRPLIHTFILYWLVPKGLFRVKNIGNASEIGNLF